MGNMEKVNSRKTIFDLERRINLREEYEAIMEDMKRTTVKSKEIDTFTIDGFNTITIDGLLNSSIKTWRYRSAATDIRSFAKNHGFCYYDASSDEDILYSFELMINLLHWVPTHEVKRASTFDFSIGGTTDFSIGGTTISGECTRCIENLECILEQANWCVHESKKDPYPKYTLRKRSADVDATIEAVPELAEALLAYLDLRNQKDEEAKKSILHAIADYLEPKRKDYKGTAYRSLCEDLFTVFNKCNIRHNNSSQVKLRKPERMKLYDQAFKASLHLLQMEEVSDFQASVSKVKEMLNHK